MVSDARRLETAAGSPPAPVVASASVIVAILDYNVVASLAFLALTGQNQVTVLKHNVIVALFATGLTLADEHGQADVGEHENECKSHFWALTGVGWLSDGEQRIHRTEVS